MTAPGPTATTAPLGTLTVDGTDLVMRDLGPRKGVPLVLLTHLAANLDTWDPVLIDGLAEERRVILLGLPGVGGSEGRVRRRISAMADDVRDAIRALGDGPVDLLGLSMGGFVAQDLVLRTPSPVRRLVLVGTGPRGAREIGLVPMLTLRATARAGLHRQDPRRSLFFPRTVAGASAALSYLERTARRTEARDLPVTLGVLRSQFAAIREYARTPLRDLSRIRVPTLILNGDHDRMVPTALSEDLHRRIPGSRLRIYPDAGHGSIFQVPRTAARDIGDFLDG